METTEDWLKKVDASILDSINKLLIEVKDEDDGGATISITWDELDPELDWWTSMGKEAQEQFITEALEHAINKELSDHVV